MKITNFILFLTITLSLTHSWWNLSFSLNNADEIIGVWYNGEKDGKIEIFKENGEYHGEIVWVDLEPGESGLDDNNPDHKLRDRKLVGLRILKGFKFEDGEYKEGEIYDPKSGNTYNCIMRLEQDGRLYVRGYLGISLIGRTTYWTRAN